MLKYSPASYFISPILLQLLGAIKPLSYSKWNEGNLILPGSRPHTLVRWCGLVTVGALRRALPCSSSGTWLEEWLPFSCSSSGTWFWGITALLLQLWYLTGGVTSSLLLHLCFPAHLSALKDCGLCGGDMWRVAWKLLLILRIQRQIKTQAHSKVIAYQILDRNNVVLLWILLNYSPNPSVMQKFSKLWENLID